MERRRQQAEKGDRVSETKTKDTKDVINVTREAIEQAKVEVGKVLKAIKLKPALTVLDLEISVLANGYTISGLNGAVVCATLPDFIATMHALTELVASQFRAGDDTKAEAQKPSHRPTTEHSIKTMSTGFQCSCGDFFETFPWYSDDEIVEVARKAQLHCDEHSRVKT